MNLMTKSGTVATIASICALAIAGPCLAQGHGGGGGRGGGGGGHGFGGGGHSFGGGGHAFGGGRSGGGAGGFRGGGGRGGWGGGGWGGDRGWGYGYGGYGGDYYGDEDNQCVAPRRVWDPNYGRYVVRNVPYRC